MENLVPKADEEVQIINPMATDVPYDKEQEENEVVEGEVQEEGGKND